MAGALLVAPPDCERREACAAVAGFGPAPRVMLPFPSIVVASRNDPFASAARTRAMASLWGSEFVDAGDIGHINADSGLGSWHAGQQLLEGLIGRIGLDPGATSLPAAPFGTESEQGTFAGSPAPFAS